MTLNTAEKRLASRRALVPEGAVLDERSSAAAEVYRYERGPRLFALAFWGSAGRPSWHFLFRNAEERERRIGEFFESAVKALEAKAERKRKASEFRHTLKVGDVVHTSWGYDQTNVTFFEVTRVVSDKSVAIRPIRSRVEQTGTMSGRAYPRPGEFCGEETVRRVREGNIVVNAEHGHYPAFPGGAEGCFTSWYA